MSSIANALTSSTAGSSSTSSSTTSSSPVTDPLGNESTFLTLLVSQLQNQDPLAPTDSNQFVAQLTSYSQLEQLIGIHQNTTTMAGATSAANPAAAMPATGTTSSSATSSTTGTTGN